MSVRPNIFVAVAGAICWTTVAWAQPATQPTARGGNFYRMVTNWTQVHMPALKALIDETPINTQRRVRLLNFANMRMQNERSAKGKPVEERVNRYIGAENSVFELVLNWKHAEPEAQAAIEQRIRAQVSQIIEDNLADRQRKLDELRAKLHDEELRLERDRNNTDQLVRIRMQFMMGTNGPTTRPQSEQPSSALGAEPQ